MFKPTLNCTGRVISSWNDLLSLYSQFDTEMAQKDKRWIFRGQRRHNSPCFSTSLERAASSYSLGSAQMPNLERWLVKEFTLRMHHYVPDPGFGGDHLEWLALMQHYGAPTRLHDWTYSFFVAAYFAVERANGGDCEIWALNTNYFNAERVLNPDEYADVKRTVYAGTNDPMYIFDDEAIELQTKIAERLWKRPTPLVHPVNPFRLNDRLTSQQGLFLFPGDISCSFEANLGAEAYTSESESNLFQIWISCDIGIQIEILKNLHRMNIDRATLFPGLGGFAESLRTRLAFLPESVK